MSVVDRVADLCEELEPCADVELVLRAIVVDRDALDELHHEVRSALWSRASLKDLRNGWMIHHRERLALGLEAGDDLCGVHPRLDDLHRDAAFDGLLLITLVDRAEAAFTEELQDLEGSDLVASDDPKRG